MTSSLWTLKRYTEYMTRWIIPGIRLKRIQYFICGFADSARQLTAQCIKRQSARKDEEAGGRKETHRTERWDHRTHNMNFCFIQTWACKLQQLILRPHTTGGVTTVSLCSSMLHTAYCLGRTEIRQEECLSHLHSLLLFSFPSFLSYSHLPPFFLPHSFPITTKNTNSNISFFSLILEIFLKGS